MALTVKQTKHQVPIVLEYQVTLKQRAQGPMHLAVNQQRCREHSEQIQVEHLRPGEAAAAWQLTHQRKRKQRYPKQLLRYLH